MILEKNHDLREKSTTRPTFPLLETLLYTQTQFLLITIPKITNIMCSKAASEILIISICSLDAFFGYP